MMFTNAKLSLILFALTLLLRYARWRYPQFAVRLKERDLVAQIKARDEGIGRWIEIRGGKIRSGAGRHPKPDIALAFKDALLTVVQKTGRKIVVVASSDLSHYHSHVDAEALDSILIEHIRKMNPDSLNSAIQDGKAEACGFGGILSGMFYAREHGLGKSAILEYTDSGEVSGDRRRVVGYLSAALY